MRSENETVAEIAKNVRSGDYGCAKCDDMCDCPNTDKIIVSIMDRIDAAHKREMEKLAASLALAKKRLKAEVADKSMVVSELNEIRELNRRCCDENERLNSKVDELRECLEEAASVRCHECFHSDHGRCEAHHENCMAKKWRKALEGANDESK